MLSIPNPGKGGASAAYYFNYYNTQCAEPAEYLGIGAAILHVHGNVDREVFMNMMNGTSPDGRRDLVKNAFHEDEPVPVKFSEGEIKSLPQLVKRLKKQSDPVSAFVWQNLSKREQALLNNFKPSGPSSKECKAALAQALNRIIEGECMYERDRFKSVLFRPETAKLLKQHPTGPPLARLNHSLLLDAFRKELAVKRHTSHWDLTFNAPKDVSILYAYGSEEVRKVIIEAHKFAVKTALEYAEANAAFTRSGKGGAIHEHCGMIGSLFIHIVNRLNEVHLHTHAVMKNIGFRANGSTGSLHSIELFRQKLAIGEVYQTALAHRLENKLHVVIEPQKVGFNIKGVPSEIREAHSTPAKKIKASMKAQGTEGPIAAKEAAQTTRPKKQVMEKEALEKKWGKIGESVGWGQKEAAQLIEEAKRAHESGRKKNEQFKAEQRSAGESRADEKPKSESKTEQTKTERPGSNEKKTGESGANDQKAKTSQAEAKGTTEDAKKKARVKPEEQRIKEFRKELRKAIDRIYPEKQNVRDVVRLAMRLARKHGVDANTAFQAVRDAHLPVKMGIFRWEWQKVFPHAKSWNPVHNLRTPRLVLFDQSRKWGEIKWQKTIAKTFFTKHELRIQKRNLAPNAPKWSPLHGIAFPALRLVAKKAESNPTANSEKKKTREKRTEHAHKHTH